LAVGGTEDWVKIPQEEGNGHAETNGDEDPVEDLKRRPRDAGDRDPDKVGVSVESPAFEEHGRFAAEVAEGEEEGNRNEKSVAVDEASGTCDDGG